MAYITLAFCSAKDLASDAIKIYEDGWCSHVAAVLDDGTFLDARHDVCGTVPAGVQIRDPNTESHNRVQYVKLPCTDQQKQDWLTFLHSQIGKPYDSVAIIAFPLGTGWSTPGTWICSGLQTKALTVCKFFIHDPYHPPEETTPFELLLMVTPLQI